ncbi:hypothetical protein EVG20_g694 [Dentipellis fragilis]|uniref:Programmed cell death protein 2 C-terminal domain-containing protein n=1 Tax=Dentipellis fragilis TaxID=205917 RepID=A0A4Y9ZCV5_9AGAM|nr:hypothetical protein EVG20_g694 [Dentipellis fragilis]
MAALAMDDSDWSSSDEEATRDVETSVLLGVPDGPVETDSDLTDAAVSRIGGLPVGLIPVMSIHTEYIDYCRQCSGPMELLVELWCPFEGSAYDRALYIWGCGQGDCQKKDGSIRAWRGLRYNEIYARKIKSKIIRKTAPEESIASVGAEKSNPFALGKQAAAPSGGLGTSIFGGPPSEVKGDSDDSRGVDPDPDSDSESSIVVALASSTLSDSPWRMAPYHPAQYLSTLSEYIPPPKKAKRIPSHADEQENEDGNTWSSEKYENSMDTDHIFERFTDRVALEPEQCVRLFVHDMEHQTSTMVTKADFKVNDIARRVFDSVPPCPFCHSKRVFECQLMPNLINVFKERAQADEKMTDEERRKDVELLLKGTKGRGMDWGTVMVFSCEKDCCPGTDGKPGAYGWMEEAVLVQWDD